MRLLRDRFGRVIHHQPTGEPDPEAYRRAYDQRAASGTPLDNGVWIIPAAAAGGLAATEGVSAAQAPAEVGGEVQDAGPGDGGGGSSCGAGGGCGGGGGG